MGLFQEKVLYQRIPESGFSFNRILPANVKQGNPVYAGIISGMDDA